jgi:hypothetical protein
MAVVKVATTGYDFGLSYFDQRGFRSSNGEWIIFWQDNSASPFTIKFALSKDDGATWTVLTNTFSSTSSLEYGFAFNPKTNDAYIVYVNTDTYMLKLEYDSALVDKWSFKPAVKIRTGSLGYPGAAIDPNAGTAGYLHIFAYDRSAAPDNGLWVPYDLATGTLGTWTTVISQDIPIGGVDFDGASNVYCIYRGANGYETRYTKLTANATKDGWTVGTNTLLHADSNTGVSAFGHGGNVHVKDDGTIHVFYTNYTASSGIYRANHIKRAIDGTVTAVNLAQGTTEQQGGSILGNKTDSKIDLFFENGDAVWRIPYDGTNHGTAVQVANPTNVIGSHRATETFKSVGAVLWIESTSLDLYFEKYSYNSTPNAPTIDSPKGTSTSPAIIQTLTPTLDWTFSDPDSGDTQSAYQVVIYNPDGTVLKDTLKVASLDTFFNVASTDGLAWNTTYSYKVKTWDAAGVEGPFSALEYFKTNRAPTATNLVPGSTDSLAPEGASPTPRLGWTYSDADADVQAHFQVKIYDMASTPALVHDSTKVASANAYYDVPSAVLTAGVTYQWEVTVWDSNALSGLSAREYIIINNPPGAPTATSPADTKRTTVRPIFEATIADDVENDNQHFVIQIADDNAFSVGLQERNAETAVTGWQAKTSIGSFVAFPSGGVDATYEGGTVQYTWQADLIEGKTYYWRIAGIDVFSGTKGPWSATRSVRVGDTLLFQLKTPVITTAAAQRIVLSAQRTVATDSTVPASLKVEVCNNGLDAAPTWEDATNALLNGTYHTFTNTAKTAADWAVNVRVTVKANDSLEVIEIDGIGFSFD